VLVHYRKVGGETRLRDSLSIGIGGHVNDNDYVEWDSTLDTLNAMFAGAYREFNEEVLLPDDAKRVAVITGIINDDSTEVGSVHLGILFRLDVGACGTIIGHENDMEMIQQSVLSGDGADPEMVSRLETWSRLASREIAVPFSLSENLAVNPLLTIIV
jgi:predicted NUDIX family phosphoesterase